MTILLDRVLPDADQNSHCSEKFGDYSFQVDGASIPIDHAHFLYASICRTLAEFHEHNSIGIFGINGELLRPASPNRSQQQRLNLVEDSRLRIRLPLDRSRLAYKLAGKTLQLDRDKVYLHIPELELILPSPCLEARIVIIKGCQDVRAFLPSAEYHLERLGINGNVRVLTKSNGEPRCRTVTIHQRKVVGFAIRVDGLSDRDSLILQNEGIGGRRKFGSGLFIPY
jgi:CRISPR-associated protein Cas6